MEPKKTRAKKAAHLVYFSRSFGFLISLSLVIMAFEWRSYEPPIVDLPGDDRDAVIDLVDPPVTEIVPPRPVPRPIVFVETTEPDPEPLVPPAIDQLEPIVGTPEPLPIAPPEEETDIEFIFVQEPASPVGGMAAFYSYIKSQLSGRYPVGARRMGIEGRVFLEFVVEKDGTLSGIHVVKGIGGGCDELASQVLSAAPKWNPGKQRGKPVRQRLTLPIQFKLG